jgi:hypothetical protein
LFLWTSLQGLPGSRFSLYRLRAVRLRTVI